MYWESKLDKNSPIRVENLTMSYGENIIQQNLTFEVKRGDIFVIMGGSGCGKSTLLKHMIGLKPPSEGKVFLKDKSYWDAPPEEQKRLMRSFGVLYQKGALWSSRTLLQNVMLPLEQYTTLSPEEISSIASAKLSLVGLAGYESFYPAEISGGMQKRAGLARAMALDPEILFFDEPSAGLDPISSKRLDDLILQLRNSLGATVVIVTHELESIFAIANNSVFLDPESKTMIASGDPKELLRKNNDPKVQTFLRRGKTDEKVANV